MYGAFYNRGQSYFYKGVFEKAIADYVQALKLKPDFVDGYFQRGLAYSKIKNYDSAIADYSQGIKLAPTDSQLFHNRGLVYVEKSMLAGRWWIITRPSGLIPLIQRLM